MHVVRRPLRVLLLGYWLPVLAYLATIFVLSAQPNLHAPIEFDNSDKVLHLLEYGGLALLVARALRATFGWRGLLRPVLTTFALAALVGGTDEWFQSHVPGRDATLFDFYADLTGAVLALMAYTLTARL